MSKAPLMPLATAVWLVENTTLTFKQIADYCKLHEVEVQGIADGEVAKGIVGYNPIMSDQLTREEIKLSSEDTNRPLNLKTNDVEIENSDKSIIRNCIESSLLSNYFLHFAGSWHESKMWKIDGLFSDYRLLEEYSQYLSSKVTGKPLGMIKP